MADGSEPKPRLRRRDTAPTTPDPVEIAMEAEASGEEPLGVARRLLEKQERLVGWQIASERAAFALRLLTALAGLSVAAGLAAMAWSAHQQTGVSISAFHTSPDLLARGVEGEVLAARLQDRLARMQAETRNYDDGAGVRRLEASDIRVEIPQTGVSIADVQRLLRDWLGRETQVGAELTTAGEAMTLSLRVGATAGVELTQSDADVPALLQRAAEHVYGTIDPIRYGEWLDQHGRSDEAVAVFTRAGSEGSDAVRAGAYVRLAGFNPPAIAEPLLRSAIQFDPHLVIAWNNLANNVLSPTGREEAALVALRRARAEMERMRDPLERSRLVEVIGGLDGGVVGDQERARAGRCEDYRVHPCTTQLLADAAVRGPPTSFAFDRNREQRLAALVSLFAAEHATVDASRLLSAPRAAVLGRSADFVGRIDRQWGLAALNLAAAREDWAGVTAAWQAVVAQSGAGGALLDKRPASTAALALAHLGRVAEAEAAVAATPLACNLCLRNRGLIAALKGDDAAADRWFRLAAEDAPSYPQPHSDWGKVLLARGETDLAIGQLKLAHQKSPRFADPLELWGEALMAKGDAAGAARKFEAAARYTPRWGRLQLRWAQALAGSGKAAAAREHRALAAGLDLTPAERAELAALRI